MASCLHPRFPAYRMISRSSAIHGKYSESLVIVTKPALHGLAIDFHSSTFNVQDRNTKRAPNSTEPKTTEKTEDASPESWLWKPGSDTTAAFIVGYLVVSSPSPAYAKKCVHHGAEAD